MSAEMAVEVEGLTKSFGRVHALDGLDLTVATVRSRFPWPERRGQVDHHPHPARPPARGRRRGARPRRGPVARRRRLHRRSPTFPVT